MPSVGLGVVLLRLVALVAAVLCVEAIGDERYLVAFALGAMALAFSGIPNALFRQLRAWAHW